MPLEVSGQEQGSCRQRNKSKGEEKSNHDDSQCMR
jgi:hypothetical protein